MLRNLAVTTFLLLPAFTALAQTNVAGGIYTDVTWTLAGSPYIMTGPIVVFPGKTLTIEPGVEVRVQGNTWPNQVDNTLEIRGNLVAIGTPAAPITFRADAPVTDPWSWGGILIKRSQGADGNVNYVNISHAYQGFASDNYTVRLDTVHFRNCTFTDNYYGISPFFPSTFTDCVFSGNEYCVQPTPTYGMDLGLYHCDFTGNTIVLPFVYGWVTIDSCFFGNNTNALATYNQGTITHSVFDYNQVAISTGGYDLSDCVFTNNFQAINGLSVGSVRNSVFSMNERAIEITAGAVLEDNLILDNNVGVRMYGAPTSMVRNRICRSQLYNVENATDANLSIVDNCFCITDSTLIESLLLDGYDDITRGLFNYAIYDSTCNTVLQYVYKVSTPTAVDPGTAVSVQVYPNPAQHELVLELPGNEVYTVSLYTAAGQRVQVQQGSGALRMDVSGLNAGVYIAEISGDTPQRVRWVKM